MTLVFAHLGILHKLEPAVMDAQMRLTKAPEDSSVSIVSIDDDDYRNLFKAQSPLRPEALAALIDAIAAGDPAVIVVDIDTSDSQFKDIQLERRPDSTPERSHGMCGSAKFGIFQTVRPRRTVNLLMSSEERPTWIPPEIASGSRC